MVSEMEGYLQQIYSDEIKTLLKDVHAKEHISLNLDLCQLQQHNSDWFKAIMKDVYIESSKWDTALINVQTQFKNNNVEEPYFVKYNCHVRFVKFPPDPSYESSFPNNDQINIFREVKGIVVRMSKVKLLEIKREFICSKCKVTVEVESNYSLMYRFIVPECSNCKGKKMEIKNKDLKPVARNCVNFQELKIQETLSEKNIPQTLKVTLDLDLVESCKPGDCVTICGKVERRWVSFDYNGLCEAEIALRAISLSREQNSLSMNSNNMSEQMKSIKMDWMEHLGRHGELEMRDIILKSICPDVYGMFPVKLAIILAICSGNKISDDRISGGSQQRGKSHVLMIGDPGIAKSKLLLSAVSVAPQAVHTTGMGCSSAGLTAAAVKEEGEWQLEAGALVLADGGICCIDEFNLMRDSDRTSILEAMEQQTISMAKAGIVCKLNTRCAILAAANPKNLHAMSEPESTSSINIGIATPLLSRFDLVFILRDERIPEWDNAIADHLLAQVTTGYGELSIGRDSELWSTQKLQAHFAAISQVQPKLTPIASAILSAYYRQCRSDPERDHARTTVRLLESLNRLAEAHARLVFREEVTIIDAIVTIRLMESTFGFGRIVKPYDVIKEELPLGPDEEEINCILNIFNMNMNGTENEMNETIAQNSNEQNTPQAPVNEHQQRISSIGNQDALGNIEQPQPLNTNTLLFNLDTNTIPQSFMNREHGAMVNVQHPNRKNTQSTSSQKHQRKTSSLLIPSTAPLSRSADRSSALHLSNKFTLNPINRNATSLVKNSIKSSKTKLQSRTIETMSPDELDEVLSFNNVPPKATMNTNSSSQITHENAFADGEDLTLSQALDNYEQSNFSNTEPATMNINRSSHENAFADGEDPTLSQALDDYEQSNFSNTEPATKKTKVNMGSLKSTNTLTQSRVNQKQQATTSKKAENDSAFESMSVDD